MKGENKKMEQQFSKFLNELAIKNMGENLHNYFTEKVDNLLKEFTINDKVYSIIFYMGPLSQEEVNNFSIGEIDEIIERNLVGENLKAKIDELLIEANMFGADYTDFSEINGCCLLSIRFGDNMIVRSFDVED